jgi:antitoxin component of RelBE/YafQ-DinJ toxin-antitoxin module
MAMKYHPLRSNTVCPIKTEKLVVRISQRLKEQLEKKAEKMQMSTSELVRLLIEQLLKEDK